MPHKIQMNFSTLCKHHLLMLLPITDFFSALKVLRPYWLGLGVMRIGVVDWNWGMLAMGVGAKFCVPGVWMGG